MLVLAAGCSSGEGPPAAGTEALVGDPGGGEGQRPTRAPIEILPAHDHPAGLDHDHDHAPDGTPLVDGVPLSEAVNGEAGAAADPFRRLTIAEPADGAVVRGTVRIQVLVEGFALAQPGGDASGTVGALHAVVDAPVPAPGAPIPSGPDVTTFWTDTIELTLPPGRHTVVVVGSDGYRVPFDPPVADSVDVTVEG